MTGHEKNLIRNSTVEFLIFTSAAGEESIEVRYENETVWLSQKMMAALFDVGLPNINAHLKTFTTAVNWPAKQLFGNSEQFKLRETARFPGILNTTIRRPEVPAFQKPQGSPSN